MHLAFSPDAPAVAMDYLLGNGFAFVLFVSPHLLLDLGVSLRQRCLRLFHSCDIMRDTKGADDGAALGLRNGLQHRRLSRDC